MTARSPDDGAAGNGSWGFSGMWLSGPVPRCRVIPVRAVPLAAFIPSRVPGRGRGAWGGFASERSGGANHRGAEPAGGGGQNGLRPRAWRGADCLGASRPGRWPGRVCSCGLKAGAGSGGGGRGQAANLPVAHAVEDQGEQPPGGGDLGGVRGSIAAAGDDAVLDKRPITQSLGMRWMASVRAQRSIADPCLVTCPRATLRSDSRWRGVSPAHEHSCPALRNRVMSPISATITAASTGPMPGSCWMTW